MVDLSRVKTITYDSYTTLVDVYSQADVLSEKIDDIEEPNFVSRVWRSRNMMYTVLANAIDAYQPFYEIQDLSLQFALESFGYEVPKDVRDEIRKTVYKDRIAVFDDVQPAMERISDLGYEQYVISNGDPTMLNHMVEQAGIEGVLQDWISADEVETFKPDVEIYRHSAARTGTPINDILHISGGTMRDAWGAKHAGMQTVWLNREDKHYPYEHLGLDPDMTITTIHELANELENSDGL